MSRRRYNVMVALDDCEACNGTGRLPLRSDESVRQLCHCVQAFPESETHSPLMSIDSVLDENDLPGAKRLYKTKPITLDEHNQAEEERRQAQQAEKPRAHVACPDCGTELLYTNPGQ